MADVSKIDFGDGVQRNVKDAKARDALSGGTAGQVLKKNSGTDYDAGWVDETQPTVMTISNTNVVTEVGTAKTVTVTTNSGRNVTAESSDTGVATVGVASTTPGTVTVTITPMANGSCTIALSASSKTGYYAAKEYINVTIGAASGGSSVKKTRYTIIASSWSASANASGYYTYSLTLNPTLKTSFCPAVSIAGSGDSTLWTATEKSNYDLVDYYNNTATNTLVLYAKTKPTGTFYVWVEGEQA